MGGKSSFSLTAWLSLLVVGAVVPLLIFAGAVLTWMSTTGAAERDRALQDRARALALAVDREVAAWKTATSALAASSALERGRLADFHAEARRVGAQLDGWFSLCDATTQQLVNTLRPYGAPLPKSNPVVLELFRDPRPVVRDPVIGAVAQRPVLTVGAPVVRDGRVIYALNLGIDPIHLTHLLESQQLPATWVAGITDRQFRVVARSIHAEERVGRPAPEALKEAATKAPAGLATYAMTDGRPGRVAFQRLTEVPWVLVLAVPVAELPSPRTLIVFIAIAVLLGTGGVGVAVGLARRIARPIRQLAQQAPALVGGDSAEVDVSSDIQEVRQLEQALVMAAEQAQMAAQERERAAEAVKAERQRFNDVLEMLPAYVVLLTPDHHVPFANRFFRERFGESRGRRCFEYLFGRTEPCEICETYTVLKTRGPHHWEWTGPDGRNYDISDFPFTDADGSPLILEMGIDITARKQAEAALRRLNEGLEARILERTAALQEANVQLEVANSQAQEANIQLEEINAELEQEVEERQAAEGALAAANAALRESEAGYRGLIELAPDAVLVYQDGRIVYANAAALRLYGVASSGELLGRDVLDLVHPDDREAARMRVQQAQEGASTPLRVLRHRRLNGQEVPVETTATAVSWQGQRAVQAIIRDITDRRQRERELHRLNRTLVARRKSATAMMRATSEAELLDQVCTIIAEDCGHAMVWIGFAEEDEVKTVRPVAHAGFEDGYLDTLAITWADTERGRGPTGTAIRTGKPSLCRNMLTDPRFAPWRTEALRRGYAASLVLPLLTNGAAFGAVTIYSREPNPFSDDEVKLLGELADDLAYGIAAIRLREAHARAEEALRQSEERYRALVDLSPDAIFINRDNRIVFLNPAALRLFGAATAADVVGKAPLQLFHPDCHSLVQERIHQLLAGKAVPLVEEKIVRLDGAVLDVEVAASPLTDADGVAIQVILRDITGRKRAEEALRQAHGELEKRVQERTAELSRAVEQLERQSTQLRTLASELTLAEQRERRRVAGVLHDDLQQLLVGAKILVGSLTQAADQTAQETGQEITDLLLQAIKCSRSLTEELSPPILPRGGLVPALDWLGRWMEEKHRLHVVVRAEATPLAEGYDTAVLLFQSIRELLFNAAKHAQVQSVVVEVARRGDQVRVQVSDEGVGFDPAQLRVAGGTSGGFGLFSIRERLELLGGSLEIESAPGKGSRFTLWLPVPQALPPDRTPPAPLPVEPETAALPAPPAVPAGGRERKIRVLVVDDHLVVRQGLVRLLQEMPDIAVVGEAADGPTALALTRRLLPDVVTMDVGLPGMDGIEATRLIRSQFPRVRVIGLSLFEEAAQGAAMRTAGAVNYLTKSAPTETLVAAIRACVSPGD